MLLFFSKRLLQRTFTISSKINEERAIELLIKMCQKTKHQSVLKIIKAEVDNRPPMKDINIKAINESFGFYYTQKKNNKKSIGIRYSTLLAFSMEITYILN